MVGKIILSDLVAVLFLWGIFDIPGVHWDDMAKPIILNCFWWLQHLEILEFRISMLVGWVAWDNLQKRKRYFLMAGNLLNWRGQFIIQCWGQNFKYLHVWSIRIWNRWGYCSVTYTLEVVAFWFESVSESVGSLLRCSRWTPVTLLEAKSIWDMPHFNHEG